jgi:hypothetical protein
VRQAAFRPSGWRPYEGKDADDPADRFDSVVTK